jgi:arginase family enzyme
MHDVDKLGINRYFFASSASCLKLMAVCRVIEEALVHADPYGLRPLHVSFDIDACDPSIAPSTGTPVKGARSRANPLSAALLPSVLLLQAACPIARRTSF